MVALPATIARPRARRFARRLLRLGLFLLYIYVVLSLAAAFVLTRGLHTPVTADPDKIGPKHEDVSFLSREDNITLKGWLFSTTITDTGRSVIMVHGFQMNRVNPIYTAGVARSLVAHGYNVLVFDLRGAGESGGNAITIGDRERYDVLGAYDFMKQRGYSPARMTVLGLSMGAAATIEAAPQLADVAAIVADSSYAELYPVLLGQLAQYDYMPDVFNWGIINAARLFGGNPDLRPVDVVRALPGRAFLLFAGEGDTLVPVFQAKELRAAAANPASDLVIVPGARHGEAYGIQRVAYMDRLYRFIDQQIDDKKP
jgi:uncharacterized protein